MSIKINPSLHLCKIKFTLDDWAEGVFDSCDNNPSFAVPTKSLTDYQNAANWKSYASKMYGY